MTESFRFNGSEVIDEKLAFLLPLFDVTSLITIGFTLGLIGIIITKTPATMKTYKTYLLPYAVHTLLFELSHGIYSPRVLHPYFHFYPAGIARFFPSKISKALLVFGFYCSMSLYDCCIAMTLERYYAMTNFTNIPSKIPFYTFCVLSGMSLTYLFIIMGIVFYDPLESIFVIPENSVQSYLSTIFDGLDNIIDTKTVIAFTNTQKNTFPPLSLIIAVLVSSRVVIALSLLLLTEIASRNLKSKVSTNLHKYNSMLLRMTNLQFIGVSAFLAMPLVDTFYATLFLKEPSNIVNYSFAVTNFFGLYDTIVTAFCIKPYRIVLISFTKKYLCFGWLKAIKTRPLNGYTLQHEHENPDERERNHHQQQNHDNIYFVGK